MSEQELFLLPIRQGRVAFSASITTRVVGILPLLASFSAQSPLLAVIVLLWADRGVCCTRRVFVISGVVGNTLSVLVSFLVFCRSCRVIYCHISYRPSLVAYVPNSTVSYAAVRCVFLWGGFGPLKERQQGLTEGRVDLSFVSFFIVT